MTPTGAIAPTMHSRGIILSPDDLADPRWPDLLSAAGINVLGVHSDFDSLVGFMQSAAGERLRRELESRRIDLEFELHFVGWFMTPELFAQHPEYFAQDILGRRDPRGNPSVGEEGVRELAREAAAQVALRLPPTTHRHHLYAFDGHQEWCNSTGCEHLSPSEQNLVLMHAFLDGLRSVDRQASTAYAAYMSTLVAPNPRRVRPREGVFLEYAPYRRNHRQPLDATGCDRNAQHRQALDELLTVFPAASAKVLEYWLDVSYWSNYHKPLLPADPSEELLAGDLRHYAARGIDRVTTFAVWMGGEYLTQHGDGAVRRYGRLSASIGG